MTAQAAPEVGELFVGPRGTRHRPAAAGGVGSDILADLERARDIAVELEEQNDALGDAQLRRTELQRGGKGLKRTPLLRGVSLRLVSTSRQAENRARAKAVRELREAGDWCARCGRTGVETAGHERLARAHGGDVAHPDMLLCHICNGWCEDEPRLATWQGWKVSRKWPTAPCITAGACLFGAHELDEWCGVAA